MIEHLKSGLSLSSHVGCSMACSYCVLSSLNGFHNGPLPETSPQELIKRLLSGQELFLNGETPLIINNRTDPLLPAVENETYQLLEELTLNGIGSPILLISKFPPQEKLSKFFELLPLIYIYSYSTLSTDFNYNNPEKTLDIIDKYIPRENRFHYLRPIIPGENDDISRLLEYLRLFRQYGFSGSIVTGLRVTENNLPLIPGNVSYDTQHKLLEKGFYSALLQNAAEQRLDYPIFRHTSCAIAAFLHRPCKLNYYNKEDHCNPHCLNSSFCKKRGLINTAAIIKELEAKFPEGLTAKFDQNDTLCIENQITQEQLAFIRNAFGIKITAKNVLLSPSERKILGYE